MSPSDPPQPSSPPAPSLEALRREASDFARIFDSAPICMAVTRLSDGLLLEANQMFCATVGLPREALLNHTTTLLGLWSSPSERAGMLQELQRQGRVVNRPLQIRTADGRTREQLFSAEPITFAGEPCVFALVNDVTALRDAERQLQWREREFADLVDSAMDAIISIDRHHRVCLFNRAAEAMFQVPAAEALGQPLDRFIPPAWRARHAALVQGFVDSDVNARRMGTGRVVHGVRADGSEFPLEASISRVGSGDSLRLTVVARDVSALRQAEQAQMARLAAESANQAKTDFLSRMSHELRTPLNAVLGFAQLLLAGGRDDRLDPLQRQQITQIQHAGWHLLGLINDVLDLSRIEGGRLRAEVQPIAPADCLQAALEMARPQALERGIDLHGPAANAPLPPVLGDPLRLRQVLLNLIVNAIKYNRPQGQVCVSAQQGPDGRLCITVADTGQGMSPEQLAHLYEPFNRLGREQSGEEGTGIGLVLSRELARLMGGELALQSQPGVGTQACLWLPVAPAQPERAEPATGALAPPPMEPPRTGGRVLYIEDNPVNQLLMEQLLSRWPALTLQCVDSGAAGEAALASRPDLVLLDMQLPDMSGLQWLARQQPALRSGTLRVISVSASAMPEDMAAARAAGVCDYWTKPLRLDQVQHDLTRWLGPLDQAAARSS